MSQKRSVYFLYSICRVFYIVKPMTGLGGETFDDSINSTTEGIIYGKNIIYIRVYIMQ
jgi:hypothetical protein